MKNNLATLLIIAAAAATFAGCQKIERPGLGEVITDGNQALPGGPLRFFASFNKTDGPSPRWNASDSVSGNPALLFPLTYVPGVTGNAIKGQDNAAALYLNANDFDKSTSFSVAFWVKAPAQPGRAEFLFSLVQPNFSWHSSAAFVLVENQTASSVTMKFGLKDQWLEGTFSKPMFDGNWHHIVYSFNNDVKRMTYYFDGVEVTGLLPIQTTVANAVSFAGAKNLVLGGWNKHGSQAGPKDDWIKSFSGTIDQFRMYNKALTAAEALALFNSKL